MTRTSTFVSILVLTLAPAAHAETPTSPGEPNTAASPSSLPTATRDEEALEPRDDYLRPAAGRVELRLESINERERVGISTRSASHGADTVRALEPDELHWQLCETPCSIWVRPGVAHVVARGDRLEPFVADVLATQPTRVRLRSRATSVTTATSAMGSLAAVAIVYGVITVAMSWHQLQTSELDWPIAGFTGIGVGVVLGTIALVIHAQHSTGVESTEPLSITAAGDWRPSRSGGVPTWVPTRSL